MKYCIILAVCLFSIALLPAQTPITSINSASLAGTTPVSYTRTGITYNWGLNPNNNTVLVNGFTAGGLPYVYVSYLTANVKMRRVNNASVSGNFSLVWAEVVNNGNTFNMLPAYQADMENFFNNRAYNKGTDNFFDNSSGNSNNIERMDWILPNGFSTPTPAKYGFAIFERGVAGNHDPFCIAPITAIDAQGDPTAYGKIIRVTAANYGDPGPNVTYRILKSPVTDTLVDAGTGTQGRGGVIISLQDMNVAANTTIYGYSLFANDLPAGALPDSLVNFNSATYFPRNTGNPGGIDLIAVTGVYVETSVLPVRFTQFSAVENPQQVDLQWMVEQESLNDRYLVERSSDGQHFEALQEVKSKGSHTGQDTCNYSDRTAPATGLLYYRIKQYSINGSYVYSKVIAIKRKQTSPALSLYPNPVKDVLLVSLSHTGANTTADILITDVSGKRIIAQQVILVSGNNTFTVAGADRLPPGVYQLSVYSRGDKPLVKSFRKA